MDSHIFGTVDVGCVSHMNGECDYQGSNYYSYGHLLVINGYKWL